VSAKFVYYLEHHPDLVSHPVHVDARLNRSRSVADSEGGGRSRGMTGAWRLCPHAPSPSNSFELPDGRNRVFLEKGIPGGAGQTLDPGLRDEHAVKWILMMRWKGSRLGRVTS
jgi:hypothetical protein